LPRHATRRFITTSEVKYTATVVCGARRGVAATRRVSVLKMQKRAAAARTAAGLPPRDAAPTRRGGASARAA
jgi:hypothetical protein